MTPLNVSLKFGSSEDNDRVVPNYSFKFEFEGIFQNFVDLDAVLVEGFHRGC